MDSTTIDDDNASASSWVIPACWNPERETEPSDSGCSSSPAAPSLISSLGWGDGEGEDDGSDYDGSDPFPHGIGMDPDEGDAWDEIREEYLADIGQDHCAAPVETRDGGRRKDARARKGKRKGKGKSKSTEWREKRVHVRKGRVGPPPPLADFHLIGHNAGATHGWKAV